ncbi:MAG: DUF4860 domain-containing protein [Bacillota bacterium]|nr:DUF4860 domain-containing protein [Bacillota bacterium]
MKKSYEVLATIMLILVIGICLLQISGVSASLHERLTQEKDLLDDNRIALSYYLTKLRHFDSENAIAIRENKLFIYEEGIETCIFVEDGCLYESTVVEGFPHSAETGFVIAKIDGVSLHVNEERLVTIEVMKNNKTTAAKFQLEAWGGM